MPTHTNASQENFSTSSRIPAVTRWASAPLAANISQSPDTQEIRSRIALLALLHARFLLRGRNPSSGNPYAAPFFKSLRITGPEDYDDLRQQIRLPLSTTASSDKDGCTFLDWLEHIAWLLGKSPLSQNPLWLNPAVYSIHTRFFGDYGNSKIPSTIALKQWIEPYIWNGLLKTHQLLLAIPLHQAAKLLATPLMSPHAYSAPDEIAQAATMMGSYIDHVEKAWKNYGSLAFSQ